MNDNALASRVRTMQIILLALAAGVCVFAGVALYRWYHSEPAGGDALPMITLVSCGFFLAGAVGSFLGPHFVLTMNRSKIATGTWQPPPGSPPLDDVGKLFAVRQLAFIVGLALLEGPAFLALIALFVEGRISIVAIAALAVVLMLLRFPTASSLRADLTRDVDLMKSSRR